MINITLKDGSIREFEKNTTIKDAAKAISNKLAKVAIAGIVNGENKDLSFCLTENSSLEILTFDTPVGKSIYWHTSSHLLAQAVKRLFPSSKLAIGPAIDNGFYYDFDVETPFTPDDLEKIEAEVNKIIKEDLKIERFELPRQEAITLMKEKNEPYKVELIESLPEDSVISFYKQGEFIDLCAGPHLESTGKIKAFKLLSVAGAYWRGDENNKMLGRIYGIAFTKSDDLADFIYKMEEAKKRDHRKLGKELDLFTIIEEGPGFPFFLPKGMVVRNALENLWKEEHRKWGYNEIKTPIILNEDLWHRSGHWDHYKDNMYFTNIDEANYAVKPMNCPGAILCYKQRMHSYRDLPTRMAELGLVHRHELSGTLHGLMRVRCFTQDDAHIFMLPEQIKDEITNVINMIDGFYNLFGFTYIVELSTRPENSMGTDEQWNLAISALKEALDAKGLSYKINEGDGAFYGPKIDFHLEDCLGRTWQCGTIQLDFQLPERFDLTYVGDDGEKHRPVMIHRVIFGSIERFIGILIEHYAGAFPMWLSPVQVRILPIADKMHDYARKIEEILKREGFRVETDLRNEKIGYKIREAQLEKIPYMFVVGEKEMESDLIAVRSRTDGDLGTMSIDDIIKKFAQEIITDK